MGFQPLLPTWAEFLVDHTDGCKEFGLEFGIWPELLGIVCEDCAMPWGDWL